MIVRALTLAGGLAGAAGLSQFPEFSQQYTQRLGGAVDELARVVDQFDRDASAVGMSRQEALSELGQSGAFGARRSQTITRTIARHRDLSADLDALRAAGPFTRASRIAHLSDPQIARAAWRDYKPAAPLTFEGAVFAGTGFLAGSLVLSMLIGVLRMPFRRRGARSRRAGAGA
ncbi:DUF2937 family protein [Primorskyibacter flagellatus]|uniref:DUF2937 family protein n=1 Tax=Primorskyibacter flagellatus TaxID=1387277 RepID=UPI003A942F9F